jgi:hypothetical protein
MIFRKGKKKELTSRIIEALVCQRLRVSAYKRLNEAPYNAGSSGIEWGVNYSFLIALTTQWVNGEHSDLVGVCMAEYRRVAARRKFIERRQHVEDRRTTDGKLIMSHTYTCTHQPQPTGGSEFVIKANSHTSR